MPTTIRLGVGAAVTITDQLPRTAAARTWAADPAHRDPHTIAIYALATASVPELFAELETVAHPIWSNRVRGCLGLPCWPDPLEHLAGVSMSEVIEPS